MQGRTGIGSDLNRWPHQYHRRASLLVCVHLRFHFLVPEQVRYRRGGTIATSGGSTATLFATNDRTLFSGSATGRAVCSGCTNLCPDRRLSEPRSERAQSLEIHRAQVLEADEATPKLQQAFGFNIVRSNEGQIAIGADRIR